MNNRDDWQERFDEKFVDRKVKQVDSSNSIVIYPWKHPHSHQSQEVKAFIQAELNKVREEERERIRKTFIESISNHTGEFINPWLFDASLSHEELTAMLSKIITKLDQALQDEEKGER